MKTKERQQISQRNYLTITLLSIFCSIALVLAGNALAKSTQELADAMLERTEHQQLAASFNLEGGYRVVKGSSVWINPIYSGAESVDLDGVSKTVDEWYNLADVKWYMAYQLYSAELYSEALKSAEEAKDIYDGLNNNVGQTIGFWKVNQMTQVSFPKDGWATVAYEDLFPRPGDADYNDFVVNMRITENYNRNNELISIRMDFVPRARGAGYNHEFITVLDGEVDAPSNISFLSSPVFSGMGYATVRRLGTNGLEISRDTYSGGADLVIFPDTRTALPGAPGTFASNSLQNKCLTEPQVTARVDIMIADPANNRLADRDVVGIPNYRPVLHVKNTNKDIDVVDVNPNVIDVTGNGGIDSNGYPFGIVVPANWAWPLERQHVELAYPLFANYRQDLLSGTPSSGDVAEWYNHPGPDAHLRVFDPASSQANNGICQ
jgi:LruC domain-containing protein